MVGIFSTLGDEMTDRVFPVTHDFDFDQFGIGEEVDQSPAGVGFDFSAKLGVEPIANNLLGLIFALNFAPGGKESEFVELGNSRGVGGPGDFGPSHDFVGGEGEARSNGFLENEIDAVGGAV